MEAKSSAINKGVVFTAAKALIDAKAKKANTLMRMEYGDAFMKIPLKDYMKIVERQCIEDDEFLKGELTKIYRSEGKDKFRELIEEAKNYTNEQFLKDIEEVFGIDNANFLQTEIKRLEYANNG
jgi:hypothetical protein